MSDKSFLTEITKKKYEFYIKQGYLPTKITMSPKAYNKLLKECIKFLSYKKKFNVITFIDLKVIMEPSLQKRFIIS